MKNLITTFITLFIVSTTAFVQAQSLDEVLNKHYEAIGQEDLLEKETYIIQAKISQMGMELPMLMKMKRPNKFRMEMEMQGQKMIQVYDGAKGWVLAPWMSPEPQALEGPQLQQAMDQADIDGELYGYKDKGHSADLIGKVKVDENEVYRIKLTTKDGIVKNYYLDADSYLVTKVKSKVTAQGQEVEIEQFMGDYDNIEGVMVAKKIETKSPMGTAVITIEDVSFNENIEDAAFEKP